MAHPLHTRFRMNTDAIGWRRLTPDAIADLPEAGAVFEVANLVRNVRYIGSAQGNLRARLAEFALAGAKLPATPGGYYFRYEPAAEEAQALSARLDLYRTRHMGQLPLANRDPLSPLLVASRRAAA